MTPQTTQNDSPLAGYEVLLCVTGGIACYKSADLASKLVQAGAGVSVAMTEAACRFVTPLTFQAITRRQVYTSLWQSTESFVPDHISLADRADLMVVAPATADIIAKFAAGIADDLVSTTALAVSGTEQCPILVAPAMNSKMWQSPATQDNVKKIRQWGYEILGPAEGYLACGTSGTGRMVQPADLLETIGKLLKKNPPKKS